jgi:hypothetical protein
VVKNHRLYDFTPAGVFQLDTIGITSVPRKNL